MTEPTHQILGWAGFYFIGSPTILGAGSRYGPAAEKKKETMMLKWNHLGRAIMTMMVTLILFGCLSQSTHTFDLRATLADDNIVDMTVEVEFADEAGVEEMKKKCDRVRYDLAILLSKLKTSELEVGGEMKTKNSLYRILKRQLKAKCTKINLLKFSIHPR